MQTVSVLILSWKRPDNVKQIIQAQSQYSIVDEIIVFNNNREIKLTLSNPKVKLIESSFDFGLRTRWILGLLARNSTLLFQDDDILLPEKTIRILTNAVVDDNERAYSLHGRNPTSDGHYSVRKAFGEVEIVLTRALCLHKKTIPAVIAAEQLFFKSAHNYTNGEDIFLSYCMNAQYGKKPIAKHLPHTNLPGPDAVSDRPGHVSQRTILVQQCRLFFDTKTVDKGTSGQTQLPVIAPTAALPSSNATRRIIIENQQSPGDVLMLTAAVRDLHLSHPGRFITDVSTPFPQLWENNPYITPLDKSDPSVETIYANYPIIHDSNEGAYHFIHGFRLDLENKLGVRIRPTRFWGDIHFKPEELQWISMVHQHFTGWDTPFWLICTGGKMDYTAKWWIPEYAQKVVDHFKDRIQFVQFGAEGKGHYHPPLRGVINLVGHTDIRMFMRLMYHAHGVVCPVTFAMHLAAATPNKPRMPIRKACVVTAGGREPSNFTYYTNHVYLHANGQLRCCDNGGCWKSRTTQLGDDDVNDNSICTNTVRFRGRPVQRCMHDLVTANDVIRAIERYYSSDNLNYLAPGERTIHATWKNRITK